MEKASAVLSLLLFGDLWYLIILLAKELRKEGAHTDGKALCFIFASADLGYSTETFTAIGNRYNWFSEQRLIENQFIKTRKLSNLLFKEMRQRLVHMSEFFL